MGFRNLLLLCASLLLLSSSCVFAEVVEHTFQVENLSLQRLCQNQTIIAVNGKFPGPTVYVHEGDTLVVHVLNNSPYDITIHWHGVYVMLNAWADGASYATQCPIRPGDNFTYKFDIINQEGTLWWHAHVSWLRATVHGALIIYPRPGRPYPFELPYEEIPIFIGEWWKTDSMVELENKYISENFLYFQSDAFTINGQPGDLYQCSSNHTYKLEVKQGKTYLLRIINVAINHLFFFKIANHTMTVVAADASYTEPYIIDVVALAPGQTTDVLLKADQSPASSYYMMGSAYESYDRPIIYIDTTTTGILAYDGLNSSSLEKPIMPMVPEPYDTSTAFHFFNNLTGLKTASFWAPVPQVIDEHMFITMGLGMVPCNEIRNTSCGAPDGGIVFGNMNNVSFNLPTEISILEAVVNNIDGIYTCDFPQEPPLKFDYVNRDNQLNTDLIWIEEIATKMKRFRYNSTVEIVLQNTALMTAESHPMHLHGYDFHVLAQGFGNYDPAKDMTSFNLVNPQRRNTVAVPPGGWVVIRFRANNPGVWLMHCHLDDHMSIGLGVAFLVENGPTQSTSLPPPPRDLPRCGSNFAENIGSHRIAELHVEQTSSI